MIENTLHALGIEKERHMVKHWGWGTQQGAFLRRSLAALLGLFIFAAVAGAGAGAADADADNVSFDLSITGHKLNSAEDVLRVQQGDWVEIRMQSDKPIILHLHGYDIELPLSPGVAGRMTFEAAATGRFPVNLHAEHSPGGNHDGALFYVEVHPR